MIITDEELRELELRFSMEDYKNILSFLKSDRELRVIDSKLLEDLPDSLANDQGVRRDLL